MVKPAHADLVLIYPPEPPFDWLREGTSLWLFEENGEFAIPRIGVEAEPCTWEKRRYAANFAFADGRVLPDTGLGPMPAALDETGKPTIIGGGPMMVDRSRRIRLRYNVELTMAVSELSTFRVGNQDIHGLDLHQGGARYVWGGQQAYGMIERSAAG